MMLKCNVSRGRLPVEVVTRCHAYVACETLHFCNMTYGEPLRAPAQRCEWRAGATHGGALSPSGACRDYHRRPVPHRDDLTTSRPAIRFGNYVVTLALHDDLFDAQFVRTLAYALNGAAEIGECFETARRISKTDPDLWYREWAATAERVEAAADASAAAHHRVSARGGYFRASNYYRTAGLFLMGTPVDDRYRHAYNKRTDTFRKGAALLDLPPKIVDIPYQDTTLPGYFFRAGPVDTPRRTVILTDGYDVTVEELYFAAGAAALARGYHVLAFDGPGQGSAILDQGLVFRPDWEKVATPVVDYALTRPEIDPHRIALWG